MPTNEAYRSAAARWLAHTAVTVEQHGTVGRAADGGAFVECSVFVEGAMVEAEEERTRKQVLASLALNGEVARMASRYVDDLGSPGQSDQHRTREFLREMVESPSVRAALDEQREAVEANQKDRLPGM